MKSGDKTGEIAPVIPQSKAVLTVHNVCVEREKLNLSTFLSVSHFSHIE
jgi:hypothetical protein